MYVRVILLPLFFWFYLYFTRNSAKWQKKASAPREIFSRVEELQALGLAAPDTVELLRRLNRHGMDLPWTAITVDECARAIFQALHGAEGK